jgi:hypothetical protein
MKPENYDRVQNLMNTRNELEYILEAARKHQLTLRVPARHVIPSDQMSHTIISTLKAEIKLIDNELASL